MAQPLADALTEGLVDATGFLGGALIGWQVGSRLGFDVLAPGAWTARTAVGWLILLAGCGAGKWLSLRWRARRARARAPKE